MLFSSSSFIFIFLPLVLAGYYIIPKRFITARNVLLLIFSLGFYAWGEPKFVFVMLLSIIGNYLIGRILEKNRHKAWLVLGLVFDLGILFVFKYLNFVIRNINYVLASLHISEIAETELRLPIGISFFTFQAISYIIDVYRGKVNVQRNPLFLGLYISFFPQLIAGPIVRYSDIEVELTKRTETIELFRYGVVRFIIGLAKKVILANNLALVADTAFDSVNTGDPTVLMSWLGMLAYSLQIYFDFSGYSDMAIGLGKMFGFNFLENFNYPYISDSISEFWRRWHISMGSWFRDYVYFSMGGSRVNSKKRLIRNLFVVWFLTGLWHGADWSFIVWGLMYFVLISFEKLTGIPGKLRRTSSKAAYKVFTLMVIMLGWVMFRADDLKCGLLYQLSLFGFHTRGAFDNTFLQYFGENVVIIIASLILCTSIVKGLFSKLKSKHPVSAEVILTIICLALFAISISYIVLESYNPFIYFNF